jgi:hypothetical protein
MLGYIVKQFALKKFLLIKGQDSETYFAHYNEINFPQGHWCLFYPPSEVFFEKGTVQSGDSPQAQHVRLVEPVESLEKEVSEVYLWKGTHGFARRGCGCEVFVDVRNVITLGEIEEGTTLYHSVVPSQKMGTVSWKASEIEVCIPDPPPSTDLTEYIIYPQK